ncbi:MAG TPA: YegS/Rv2252/BmrU family lipid kinase, partial [Luteimonas sp.]|nr:YegS/Rv2252/BmrU family lipid kinase [Luteimonas sp.]
MSIPRWRLILNGKATGNEAVRDAVATLRARGVALDVRVTWEHGDCRRYVDEAVADGVDTVIAGGGDGTVSEVASALANHALDAASLPSLGVLPLGTANDLAAAAGIPDEPLAALEMVAAGVARTVDLVQVTADGATHWAVNLASGGFGTQVTVETSEGLKKLLGGLAYLITGMS